MILSEYMCFFERSSALLRRRVLPIIFSADRSSHREPQAELQYSLTVSPGQTRL